MRTEKGRPVARSRIGHAVSCKDNVETADAVHNVPVVIPEWVLLHQPVQRVIDTRFRDLLVVQLNKDAETERRKSPHDQLAVAHSASKVGQAFVLVLVAREDHQDR